MKSDCIICLESYNDSNRKPHTLIPCGHTICGVCLESLSRMSINNCPECRMLIERTVVSYALIPSATTPRSSINEQTNDILWVSLHKDLVIDVEEKEKELAKILEEKNNEKQNKINAIKSKIQNEANQKETDKLLRELDDQDRKINTEIEKIFQKNQNDIEDEFKFIKNKVNGRQLNDLNEMESLKQKSISLKNKIANKSYEIKNMKIDFKIDFSASNGTQTASNKNNQSILKAIYLKESETNLLQECKEKFEKSFLYGLNENTKRLKEINENLVHRNPSDITGWERSFRGYCSSKKLSNELTNLLIKNSKMSNWPNKLNSKELLKKNKTEFLKLKSRGNWGTDSLLMWQQHDGCGGNNWRVTPEWNLLNV